jgi:phage repressor protein C with HTH and peptisase S24 domain
MDEKELAEIRRENLRRWMEARSMTGTQLAEKIGSGRAYASLLFNPSRYFGEKAARHIEEKLRMPKGYLDSSTKEVLATDNWRRPEELDDEVFGLVHQVGMRVAEDGSIQSVPARLPPLPFDKRWLISRSVTASDRLRICRVPNAAMEPYLRAGDVVMVDSAQTVIQDGEVYAIRHGDDIRLRRLFVTVDGGIQLRSDNPAHPTETLTGESACKLVVVGRVIWRAG